MSLIVGDSASFSSAHRLFAARCWMGIAWNWVVAAKLPRRCAELERSADSTIAGEQLPPLTAKNATLACMMKVSLLALGFVAVGEGRQPPPPPLPHPTDLELDPQGSRRRPQVARRNRPPAAW